MFLAIFEFLGTSELLVILVVALIVFGPRKLPQMSRKLGRSLSEFKRASEDFKHTWEKEVEMEKFEEEGRMAVAMLQEDSSTIKDVDERRIALERAAASEDAWTPAETVQPTVARSSAKQGVEEPPQQPLAETVAPEISGKRDWV